MYKRQALDRACIDLVRNSNDPGREHFMERVNSRHGTHTIDVAEADVYKRQLLDVCHRHGRSHLHR